MQRGQASLEYVAVVALVALVLGVAAAVAGADAIPAAVGAQMQRAYCLVSGGDCLSAEGPRPCVTRSRDATSERRLKAVLARLADGRSVLTEERSDGTVAVTVTDSGEALGGRRFAGITGRLGARLSAGRAWVLPDRAGAERLVARIEAEDRAPVGEVLSEVAGFVRGAGDEERFVRFGTRGEAAAVLRGVGLDALAGTAAGLRIDGTTGRRTVELISDGGMGAALAAPFVGASGSARREVAVEAVVEPGRGPVSLTIRVTGEARGRFKVGPADASGGNRLETDVMLDLADPRARALADTLLHRPTPRNAGALVAHLRDRARVDVRLYATAHDERRGGKTLLGVGYETIATTETARLVAAYGREPSLGWSRRLDCVGVG